MRIALVGATGRVGSLLMKEAVTRGHSVTAIARGADRLPADRLVTPAPVDVLADPTGLTAAFRGQDAIIHAFRTARQGSIQERIDGQRAGTSAILAAARTAGVRRILAVGGAGTLEVDGVRNMDRPAFPAAWQGGAQSTAIIKDMLRTEPGLDWTYLSPSHDLADGPRTGRFRLGIDEMLIGADGESRISVADYAVAMIDELERPHHSGRRFTVGY
jgi:hypothetical protein